MTFKHLSAAAVSLALLAGCETQSVDAPLALYGTAGPGYQDDLARCRDEARRVGGEHIGKSAAIGGAGGALAGGIAAGGDNVPDKALAGALVGALAGAAAGSIQVKEAQRRYLVQCMQNLGHPVSG